MEARVCSRCSAAVSEDSRFCPSCGAPLPSFAQGQLIDGRYEVLELLSMGGMSEVYKVQHLHLDELRIVKIMRSDLAREDSPAERFQHEAKLASRVRHRNIARLHDFSRLEDGSFYMVSEYLDGYTVQSRIRDKGPFPPAVAIEIAVQVLTGLEAIHKAGVVHRDVSPDNIMIVAGDGTESSGGFVAKILDLGIAKSLDDDSGRTQTGAFIGKARYASPEQAGLLAPGESIDERSDIYSMGVTLYEMLSGAAPFDSPTPEGYLLKHIHETPAPLTAAMGGTPIPAGLAQIVEKAMAKNRNDRFHTAAAFRQALADLSSGDGFGSQPVAAMPEAPVKTLRAPQSASAGVLHPASRRRLVVPLLVAALALLVLSAAWAGFRTAGNDNEPGDSPRITPDPDFPPLVSTPSPAVTRVAEKDPDSYEIIEDLGPAPSMADADTESSPAPASADAPDSELPPDPPPAPPAATSSPSPPPEPEAVATPRPAPPRRATTTPAPPATPEARTPQQDRERLSEAAAVDRVLGYVSSTNYYAVRRECITTRSLGYKNEGYTIEVHGGGCPGDEKQRRLGVWRVDIWTGELFVRNARGKFVEP